MDFTHSVRTGSNHTQHLGTVTEQPAGHGNSTAATEEPSQH